MDVQTNQGGPPARKTDRMEVVKVLIIAVVSFLVGFGLVILFFKPTSGDPPPEPTPEEAPAEVATPPKPDVSPSEGQGGSYAPTGYAPVESDTGAAGGTPEVPDQGDALPEVPPGRTPAGVTLDGSGFYLKCWDASGSELPGESCDKLSVFEKRVSTRLYVVDKCKKAHAGDSAKGKLSLGVEVDFTKRALSYWNGASSDLPSAASVAKCLRTELAGLPIDGFDHKYEKYRVFFTVMFGEAQGTVTKPPPGQGKIKTVVMDRVRVRKTPVTGDVIGHISSGNKVRLLDKKDDWCHIITPNNNEGWMTCEALSK